MATKNEGEQDQIDALRSLTENDQNTPTGKRKRKDDDQKEKANELLEAEEQKSIGCKMRFSVAHDNAKHVPLLQLQKKNWTINSSIVGEIKSSNNVKTSKIFILGWMKMTMKWLTQNKLKTIFLQKCTT